LPTPLPASQFCAVSPPPAAALGHPAQRVGGRLGHLHRRRADGGPGLAGLGPAAFERAHAVGRGLTLQTVSAWLIEQQPSAPRRSPAAD